MFNSLFRKVFRKFHKRKNLHKLVKTATTKISSDILNLTEEKGEALSVFRKTANELGNINKELKEKTDDLIALASFIEEQKESAKQMMSDNEAVRTKIFEIIGEK